MNTLAEIAEAIKQVKSAIIFTHMRPDGDTVGCGLALGRALEMLGIRAEIVNEGAIPAKLLFLEGADRIRRFPSSDAEAYICVDSSDESRLGELQSFFLKGARRKLTVNIDHHISNTRYCKYNYVRERASNCENIRDLLPALGVKPDRLLASYLLMGIVTDSGCFSHGDVDGDTFRAAAEAADAGADVSAIAYETMRKQSKGRAGLYAETISRLRYFLGDRLAVALVTQDDLKRHGVAQDATEGIVDFALTVDVVEVSVCLLETGKGQYKASFRSKGRANVNEVARTFGGGGHILASGCMFFGDCEEILDRLSYAVSLQFTE